MGVVIWRRASEVLGSLYSHIAYDPKGTGVSSLTTLAQLGVWSPTLLGAPGIAARSMDATRGSWPYY